MTQVASTQEAPDVVTAPAEIERLHALVAELAVNAQVRIHRSDGSTETGLVTVTPTVQMFRLPGGDEGINGLVKLEDRARPDWSGLIWLTHIARVEHLDSVTRGASKA